MLKKAYTFSFAFVSVILLQCASCEVYQITTTWNNKTIDHPNRPVNITLEENDELSFKILVEAPFFNDTKPDGPAGEPFYGLWDYEVVEVFLLNDAKQYVEIELGPHGQHIVLLLKSQRNTISHSLPITYTAYRNATSKWFGTALIPIEYLPPNVTKMNAYAIHGSEDKRVYEALYPVSSDTEGPDFHNLDAFKPFNVSIITANEPVTELSSTWNNSMDGIRTLELTQTKGNETLSEKNISRLEVSIKNSHLQVEVDAFFYNDTAAPTTPSGSLNSLNDYEVMRLFLRGDNSEYFELQLGPWGHYSVAFWNTSYTKATTSNFPITAYNVNRDQDRWNGQAEVPIEYLPPNVTKWNAFLVHGQKSDKGRIIDTTYPSSPSVTVNMTKAENYQTMDFDILYSATKSECCSAHWQEIDPDCGSGAARPLLAFSIFSILFFFVLK